MVEKRAIALLEEHGVRSPAVDVEKLARNMGIRVEKTDLGENCSGILMRRKNLAVIGVRWSDHPNRQRFTIAHEIAHYVLHKGDTYVDNGNYFVNFRDAESGTGTKLEERQANRFAAALLMPESWVRAAFRRAPVDLTDDESLRTLAEEFEVSPQAMTFRLTNLGLLRL